MSERTTSERARDLVSTSVQDLQSSLGHYTYLDIKDIETVRAGFAICKRRGEKTKATILRRKLKKMEKQFADARHNERVDAMHEMDAMQAIFETQS